MNASKKLERAFIKKSFQDGVIQGVKLLSNAIIGSQIIDEPALLNNLTESIIRDFTKRMDDLEKSKEPQYIFSDSRQTYIEHIRVRNWTQKDYIYLHDAEQLRGTKSPIVHYVGNYSNNPKYDEVRRMERDRTFKNKVEK